MEIIYYWMNKREHITNQGFNFNPEIHCKMEGNNDDGYVLTIDWTGKRNIMHKKDGVIVNTTVIVGMNGSGKTTLMNELGFLNCYPEKEPKSDEYEAYINERNEENRCLYVTRKGEETYIITNIKKAKVHIIPEDFPEDRVKYYSDFKDKVSKDIREGNELNGISSIYITNASYSSHSTSLGTHNGITELSFMPSTLSGIKNSFFQFIYPDRFSNENDTLWEIYSREVRERKSVTEFQQFCDLYFYAHSQYEKQLSEIEKKNFFKVNAASIFKIYNDQKEETAFLKLKDRIEILGKLYSKDLEQDSVLYVLKSNLVVEFYLANDDFPMRFDDNSDMILLYENIVKQIQEGKKCNEKYQEYFVNAINEINKLEDILSDTNTVENSLPKNDWGYKVGLILKKNNNKIALYLDFIKERIEYNNQIINNETKVKIGSFCMRYLYVDNLGLSSGERAWLNLMSWLYWLSQMGNITSEKRVRPKKNILVCIDEIDAMCHPKWQRDIIGNVIEEIENNFKEYKIQLVISTHSPLCLSNIPRENTIYLKNDKMWGIYQDESTNYEQTFARNIYDILNDAFYLEGQTIGNYAVSYINELIGEIREKDEIYLYNYKEEYIGKINYIGDSLVRSKMFQLLESKMPKERQDEVRKECLLRQKNMIEEEIRRLEKND